MTRIHPSALVDPGARIADGVEIGAFTIVGPNVEVGANTVIGPHVVIDGHTKIGADNRIFQFCSIGGQPQDKKYAGEPTRLEIGDRNTIRESCTFNIGTTQDGGITRVGNDNWVMAYVHVAHDCSIGDNCIFANSVQLAGHVQIGDFVIIGGISGVHQFVRIGSHSMAGMTTSLSQDLPPYVMASGNPAAARGINVEGLRRRGFSAEAIAAIRRAYKTIYVSGMRLEEAREAIAAEQDEYPELKPLVEFLSVSGRGIVR
ncbi:MAG TPA: acyl-ACP--UDP-N-acetylglucosamine O-acyltransferase [Rhodocyclaceae bacterium]|jgi:UDP-N-acetylglucosamine acyltransferase|nr:acyl-ACP--UDP-N-acetylglucosamine O-acyltransferase [Rhodocyclaceae bacterium]